MPSTYTTSLKIQQIGNGEQSGVWGNTTNTNWTLIEQAITGVVTITMENADYTLSNLNGVLDEARNIVLVVQGINSATRKIIAPLNQQKTYIISNQTTGGYDITIGAVTGSFVTIPYGVTAQVYTDGTSFFSSQTGSAGDFYVNGNATVEGSLTLGGTLNYVPAGTINMWPTATAPSGFLLCNGTAVSRTAYAALFGVIGTTFGSGDGSSTFTLPNYTNRFPYGATVGATGGTADAIVVDHSHSINDPGHSHFVSWIGYQRDPSYTSEPGVGFYFTQGNTNASTTGISVNSTGSSGTNANLPPYLGINFIIKT